MKTFQLMDGVQFNDSNGHAEPIYFDKMGRALLFALRPGQAIKEHNAPHSPIYFVVLKGSGMCAGSDGTEHSIEPSTLVVMNPGESHTVRALDEGLIYLMILHGSPWGH
jgi:quercetin dioxygenase-like cupin family protein